MKKTEVFFNKPVYVGQAILDLSRTLMFDFFVVVALICLFVCFFFQLISDPADYLT